MILKLPKEINRKVRSNCTLSFIRYIGFSHTHLDIFFYFGKGFFLFCIRKAKKKKKNKCVLIQLQHSLNAE